jgi:hypothetical protein
LTFNRFLYRIKVDLFLLLAAFNQNNTDNAEQNANFTNY